MQSASISQVGTIFVPVTDQERSLAFFVGQLGFEKRADFPYSDGLRWVEVAPRDSAIALALVPAAEGMAATSPAAHCALVTDDIHQTVATLRSQGIDVEEVGRKGTSRSGLVSSDVTIKDPFPPQCCFCDPDGNRFLLVQPV